MVAKKKAPVKKARTKKSQPLPKAETLDEYGLTTKEREFADLHRGGDDDVRGNAKRCYMRVHPKAREKTAEVEGSKLLRNPKIVAYITKKTEEVSEKADITVDRVLQEIARIGLFDVRKLVNADGTPKDLHELDDDTAAAISGLKVVQIGNADAGVGSVLEYKLANKNEALEKLMKYLGAYEKDNRQKVDPLVALLERVSGSALKPVE